MKNTPDYAYFLLKKIWSGKIKWVEREISGSLGKYSGFKSTETGQWIIYKRNEYSYVDHLGNQKASIFEKMVNNGECHGLYRLSGSSGFHIG